VKTNEPGPVDGRSETQPAEAAERPTGVTSGIGAGRRLLGRRLLRPILAVATIALVVGAAWVASGPSPFPTAASVDAGRLGAQPGFVSNVTGTSGGATKELTPPGVPGAGPALDGSTGGTDAALISSLNATLIVRNGQVVLEVADLDKAVSAAQSAITGLGGYASDSTRSGVDEYATASVTYRLPVAKWDDALKAVHGIGTKVLSEQTGSSDVTAQAIDLDARISNLKSTEAALQAIMARATVVADVIAVRMQLSQVQGEIESLTAQVNRLKDQASMSTLAVTFQLPSQTITTQATNEWTLGSQVDQALAALVRIAQGLATIVVWALLVALPSLIGLLILLGAWRLVRRITRRGRGRREASPAL
jgi:hypothetical protein